MDSRNVSILSLYRVCVFLYCNLLQFKSIESVIDITCKTNSYTICCVSFGLWLLHIVLLHSKARGNL